MRFHVLVTQLPLVSLISKLSVLLYRLESKLEVYLIMRHSVRRFILAFALAALSTGINLSFVQAQAQSTATLDQFERLTATSGWILLDQKLFWTSDAGDTWEEIGPSLPSEGLIQDVKFIDDSLGWVLWTTAGSVGSAE